MAAKKSKKSARPSKPARSGARKKSPTRAAAKPARSKAASKGDSSGVVYSDVRRDALAWQLNKLR